MPKINRAWIVTAFFVYSLLLIAVSLIPMDITRQNSGLASLDPVLQNALHVPMMAVFSFLLLFSFECFASFPMKGILLGIGVSFSFALLLELVQLFVPGRYPSLMDMGLNIAGIGVGIVASWMFFRWMRSCVI